MKALLTLIRKITQDPEFNGHTSASLSARTEVRFN